MNNQIWKEVTDTWDREHGGSRFVRIVDENCWISVLHRLTGFGYFETETAICFRKEKDKEKSCYIMAGDRREELSEMPREKLMEWYNANIEGNRNSMDTLLEILK